MDHLVLPLPFDSAALSGLSPRLLESHHQNNYAGAVKRLNAIRREMAQLSLSDVSGYRLNGLKREELVALNSMLLHELYFDSLGGDGEGLTPAFALAFEANFGSVERWREEFVAMGKALAGGSGWVVLTFLPRDGSLVNQWGADHTCSVAGGIPLLALDMYEHAYHLDHGASAAKYVDAFMLNIQWARVYARYQAAVESAAEPFALPAEDVGGVPLLDVRRAGVYAEATEIIDGARWRDPARVEAWASELARGERVVVYCVYGHEVGRATALRLRGAGVDARFLRGGFVEWKSAGLPLQAKEKGAAAK